MPLDTFLSFKIHRLDCLKCRIMCGYASLLNKKKMDSHDNCGTIFEVVYALYFHLFPLWWLLVNIIYNICLIQRNSSVCFQFFSFLLNLHFLPWNGQRQVFIFFFQMTTQETNTVQNMINSEMYFNEKITTIIIRYERIKKNSTKILTNVSCCWHSSWPIKLVHRLVHVVRILGVRAASEASQ